MAKCVADKNSRCVHECAGEFCRAYYHHREDRCFGTCDLTETTEFLQTQMVYQMATGGWSSFSSGELKMVAGLEISRAAAAVGILARSLADDEVPPNVQLDMLSTVGDIYGSISADSKMALQMYDLKWSELDIPSLLKLMQSLVRGAADNA